jgi:hypothetical protein
MVAAAAPAMVASKNYHGPKLAQQKLDRISSCG